MSTCIKPISNQDVPLLVELAQQTFWESHGHSAAKEDIEYYLNQFYTTKVLQQDIHGLNVAYRLLYFKDQAVGFSKVILNQPYPSSTSSNLCKLERIYVLQDFHGHKLGLELFEYNMDLARSNNQKGLWLYTWTGNDRAINFYKKLGFQIVGSHDFKISPRHSNPNHLMLLEF